MNEVQVTVVGTVCSEIRYSKTEDDIAAARFQIRCLPRRFDPKLGTWTDGNPSYYSATCWRRMADHVASSMGVGDPVVATGRLRISQWRRGEERLVSAEIDVQAIGHDLRWGTSAYRRGGPAHRSDVASLERPGAARPVGTLVDASVGISVGTSVDPQGGEDGEAVVSSIVSGAADHRETAVAA